MEYIPWEVIWHLLDATPRYLQGQIIDQFCRIFVQLYGLNWRAFDDSLPEGNPYFFIDRWLGEACITLQDFPELDASSFLSWVAARRSLFACVCPSPVHQDFHPGNVLVKPDKHAMVIDWTGFEVTDPRFDLGWTLVLAHAHGYHGMRDQILHGYELHVGKPVDQIEAFEAIACVKRLFSLTVSLTHSAQRLGMTDQAVESMQATMDAHRRVYQLFLERTGLQIEAFDNLFGED